MPIALTLPRPHPAQQAIIDSSKRFNVVCCGRRWGKTELGMDRLVHAALTGKPTAWFSPSYKQLSDAWRELQRRLQPITRDVSQQEHRLDLKGGGTVECWSLDSPDAGRGRAFACLIVDEAAWVGDLERAWQETLRPTLADYTGEAWFLSTPQGTSNYFHALYQKGNGLFTHGWKSWQMPTSSNPYISAEEIEAARHDMSDSRFAQEWEAQFVSWEGQVFRRILDAVVDPAPEGDAVAIGADWAGTGGHGDFTVFVAINARGGVCGIDRFRGASYDVQRDRLRAFWERMGGRSWVYAEDNSFGSPLISQLQIDGLPIMGFHTTSASKAGIVESLALGFERGTIRIPNDPVLIGELQGFEGKVQAGGLMKYGAPAGLHDDTVMALAIAWQALGLHEQQRIDITRYLLPPGGGGYDFGGPGGVDYEWGV